MTHSHFRTDSSSPNVSNTGPVLRSVFQKATGAEVSSLATTGKLRQAQWRARKLCVVGATYTHRQQVPATWHKVAGTSYTAQTQLRLPPIVTAAAHMALAYIQHQLPAPKVCKSASRKLRNELEYSHHELPGESWGDNRRGKQPRIPKRAACQKKECGVGFHRARVKLATLARLSDPYT
ncbi:hypothetical protein Bbelb_439540 [Branchiostoma belcheri]|nr:hypothetical protein Bbelb_439540 [Branchiostoma belcheri]